MDRHILVVEDSPTQSLLVSRVLEDAGFQVHAASDGLAALAHMSTSSPRLVISDVSMPGMDGYELCRSMRAQKKLENIPVLLLTNLADEEKVLAGLEAGADAFISKPFDNARLLARVGDLLGINDMAENEGAHDDAEVLFARKKYRILADRSRILRYLISTYDNALQINARLATSQAELRNLNAVLEAKVRGRTAALSQEIDQRKHAQHVVQVTNSLLEIANRDIDKESLLRDFQSEIASFSGCETVVIRLHEQDDSGSLSPQPGSPTAKVRIPIRLGEEVLGDVLLADERTNQVADETIRVIEAASAQLAAALRRIQAEQTLRESEEKYRHFFEDDLAGALIITPDGKITSCNPAFARMFGFSSPTQAVGSSVLSMYRSAKDWDAFFSLLAGERTILSREAEYRGREGAPVFVIQSAVGKFDDKGALVEIRQYLVDITEKKGLEHQLFQSQKMEAIGRVAGGVAHDFNNILQVIQGFADHLLAKTPPEDPRHNWLKQIRVASDKAGALTQSLLAFSRKQEQHAVVLNLNTVMREIDPMLRQLIGAQVQLDLRLTDGVGDIDADRSQIDQVLMNLAANARDAMPQGGSLTYETSNVDLGSDAAVPGAEELKPGAYVLLAVRDTGNGMDRETMDHMFEPFYTTKEKGKGTGLGLATLYGIVKQAGGHVSCASIIGKGTEFGIYLPRAGGAPR